MREEHNPEAGGELRARLEALQRQRGGRLYLKVQLCAADVDDWPSSTTSLYLDGVLFADHPDDEVVAWDGAAEQFIRDLATHAPTLVVARGYADRTILGLLLAAEDLLSRRTTTIGQMRMAAICRLADQDANINWVYHRRNIELVDESSLDAGVQS